MLCREVQNYISTAKGLPFFYIVGDDDYLPVLEGFKQSGLSVVRMSDFCQKDDKFPSVDDLIDHFRTADVDYRDNKFVVVGLGEFLALRGATYAEKELRRLKSTTLGNARAILLLRGVSEQAKRIISDDNKMIGQQRVLVSNEQSTDISIINAKDDYGLIDNKGIKNLLRTLEDGNKGRVMTSSSLVFDQSIFPVSNICGAHSIIKLMINNFMLDEALGTTDQWERLLKDLVKSDKSLKTVFSNNNIDDGILDDLAFYVTGLEYKNWLAFVFLKENVETLHNVYLRRVVEQTKCFDDFKNNLLVGIIKLSHNDPDFRKLYDDRKRLLKDFAEEDIAVFVKANEIDPEESIYRLTDNTLVEKKTIVKWIAHNGLTDAISYVYPALSDYLRRYTFEGPLSESLTEYFDKYKYQKVTNRISDEFMALVIKHAENLTYAQLPTRDNAIKAIPNKENAYLYWVDALGVEYLSYITSLAKRKGLSIKIDVVRSDLPTITSINKQFFEQWKGGKKYKEEQLDNIKHKEKGGYFFTYDEDPIHIPAELTVVEKAINTAAMELGVHNCKSFVIASDHGASRLAVIKKQEVPYDTDTKGEHSGRCCKVFEGCDVPYRLEDNGFVILSDYGRFRGSRPANVEVHGGASLEEIVVPVITLTLKKQSGVKIIVMHPDSIIADRHNGVKLSLYISDVESPDNVRIVIGDKTYKGVPEDASHYTFELNDIKRAKTKPFSAEVFDASDLIGTISFKVRGKTAIIKDDFDFGEDF